MRVRTITSERSDGPQDVPILGFADEPDIARLIAAHTVFGGPTDSSSMSSVSRHRPRLRASWRSPSIATSARRTSRATSRSWGTSQSWTR
jgi:hypothetical protein